MDRVFGRSAEGLFDRHRQFDSDRNRLLRGQSADRGSELRPRFTKGLRGQTLDSVREGLNRWYAANPDRLQRPIIETIWFEMAVPGLQKNK